MIDDENQKIEIRDKQGKETIVIDGKANMVSIAGEKKIELAQQERKTCFRRQFQQDRTECVPDQH